MPLSPESLRWLAEQKLTCCGGHYVWAEGSIGVQSGVLLVAHELWCPETSED